MRITRAIGSIAAGCALVICLLVLIGAHFYGLPFVSPIGSTVLSVFGPWLIVVLFAIGALEIWVWRASRSRGAVVLMTMAIAATVWASVALARMLAEFHNHGVPINLVRTFGMRVSQGSRPDDDLVYGAWQDQPLHVVVYKPRSATPGRSAPILLYIHGGGFTMGDRFESGSNLRWFTDRGWLALSIDYTLSSVDRHLSDITTSQVACAMVWTAANAARFGGDPTRISLLGTSAGGNLAINAGYLANSGRLESSCGGAVPRVSAVSALYPPVDLAAAWVSQVPGISDMARQFNTYYVGGSPERFPDRYRFVASATHISAAAPPTLVILGDNDHLVPPDATDRFAQQARNAGVDVESIRFPYGDHGFNLNQYGIGNQFYLGMTYQFLSKHGQRPANSTEDLE
jgi:acetyl esterase/lipase